MSHQDRRDPLPVDYQYPTHGVDCDCPPCRERVMTTFAEFVFNGPKLRLDWTGRVIATSTNTGYGFGV